MKSKIAAITLLASTTLFGYSNTSFAETCYEASGSVTTENVTSTLQIGNISLTLSDDEGNVVFGENGSLVGNITGADGMFTTLLSHKARFPQGDSFVTNDDTAVPDVQYGNPVRAVDGNEVACSYWIRETISDIAKGTRFFKDATSVEVFAVGYISNCPDENENSFILSGELCVQ